MAKDKKFYEFRALAGSAAELWIYEEVGGDWWSTGVTAVDLCQELAQLNVMSIDVRINSPGGSVSDGLAIYNALKRHPANVTTYIDGLAASIASVIALAGNTVVMAENALFMIHNPWTCAQGDSDDMRKAADILDKFGESIATAYCNKTGMSQEEVLAAMDVGTWYTATEAKAAGFVDQIGDELQIAASAKKFDLKQRGFKNMPGSILPKASATVDGPGKTHALQLVQDGKVDKTADWSFTATDGDKILGDPADWPEYGKWFLGVDDAEGKETKAHYKYPFGKDGKVFRSAVIAAKDYAGAQKETEIETAASHLLAEIDKAKTSAKTGKKVKADTGDDDPDEMECYCTGCAPEMDCEDCENCPTCINPLNTEAVNASTTHAPKGRNQEVLVMAEETIIPANGVRDFNAEANTIVAMCQHSNCTGNIAEFVAAKLTPNEVGEKILDLMASGKIHIPAAEAPPVVDLGKDAKKYSYTNAIGLMAKQQLTKEKPSGLEWEVHQTLAKANSITYQDRGGILIPHRVQNTALTSTGVNTGAETVFQEYGEFIDILRNMMVSTRMGARLLTGLKGPINFPKQTAASSGNWMAENSGADTTQSNPTFGTVTLHPKTFMAQGALSRQLIVESTPDIEGIVRNDLAEINALGWDLASLHGTGLNNQPTGIYNAAGVNAVAFGGVPGYGHMVDMSTAVANYNALLGATGYVTTPAMAGKMMQTLVAASAGSKMIWDGTQIDGQMAGYKAFGSNQVSSTLGAGAEHGIIFGNWQDLMIGLWGALEILVDPYTLAGQGLLKITTFQMIDIALRRAQSFSKSTGATIV